MNLFAFAQSTQAVLFKAIAKDGVSVIEFVFSRNIFIGGSAAIIMCFIKKNPIKELPRALYWDMFFRSFVGHVCVGLLNLSVTYLPMGTAMILFQMNPFWIALLACIVLRERIRLIEIVGIFICFGGVIMISLSKAK